MGFNPTAIRFFLSTNSEFAKNPKTLVLGHQAFTPTLWLLFQLKRKQLVKEWKKLSYIDDFLECSGIQRVDYLDNSSYEGANILHDLGQPVPQNLVDTYDLVMDAGTLEHVPDFLTALSNTKKMVKVGGYLFIIAPANNFLGHGCYQLSPEIFHRALALDQGFNIKYSILHVEGFFGGRWINIPDSSDMNQRLNVSTKKATYICILARKISDHNTKIRNQSDYEVAWIVGNQISRIGSLYLRASYPVQRILNLLILNRKYAWKARKLIKRLPVQGVLRLPLLQESKSN
jgi:SAM-dependent methyltransferase